MKMVREQRQYREQGKRRCCICHDVFPMTTEFFHSGSKKCKVCVNTQKKSNYRQMSVLDLIPHRWKEIHSRCKRTKIPFRISIDDLRHQFKVQNGKCYYTHRTLTGYQENIENFSLSVDRVDSSRGYEKDNVVLCGTIINKMKLNLTTSQFVSLCSEIVNGVKS
jgi:hypothetical protein